MQPELTIIRGKKRKPKFAHNKNAVNIISTKHIHDIKMGTGSCKLCDCPVFVPSSGGKTCINQNSAGGTCNHYESEHN